MTSALNPLLGPEFDKFLFAPIGEQSNGMLLSVLSALARLDLDPWQEAAKLARLPGKTATERLASLIASLPETSLPDESWAHPDPETSAARLVALLPRQAGIIVSPATALPGIGAVTGSRAFFHVMSLIFVLSVLFFVAGRQPVAQIGANHAAVSEKPTVQPPTDDIPIGDIP